MTFLCEKDIVFLSRDSDRRMYLLHIHIHEYAENMTNFFCLTENFKQSRRSNL